MIPPLPRARAIPLLPIPTITAPYLLVGPIAPGLVGSTLHKELVRRPVSPPLAVLIPLRIRILGVVQQTGPFGILCIQQKTFEPFTPSAP